LLEFGPRIFGKREKAKEYIVGFLDNHQANHVITWEAKEAIN